MGRREIGGGCSSKAILTSSFVLVAWHGWGNVLVYMVIYPTVSYVVNICEMIDQFGGLCPEAGILGLLREPLSQSRRGASSLKVMIPACEQPCIRQNIVGVYPLYKIL